LIICEGDSFKLRWLTREKIMAYVFAGRRGLDISWRLVAYHVPRRLTTAALESRMAGAYLEM